LFNIPKRVATQEKLFVKGTAGIWMKFFERKDTLNEENISNKHTQKKH
jgi:hypothetical protein